ncbi:MAG: response regulator [Chthoniobacteraceae bacterium]
MAKSRRYLLLLEDNAEIRRAFVALFEVSFNFAVHLAISVREAIGIGERQDMDAAVVDLRSAPRAAERLAIVRSWRAQLREFPVIIPTQQHQDSLESESFAAGADDFIRKPYLFSDLHTRLSRRLAHSPGTHVGIARVDGVLLPAEPFVVAGAIVSSDLSVTFPDRRLVTLGYQTYRDASGIFPTGRHIAPTRQIDLCGMGTRCQYEQQFGPSVSSDPAQDFPVQRH